MSAHDEAPKVGALAEVSESPEGAIDLEAEVARVARRDPVGWRSPALMVAVAAFSAYLAWSFRAEVAYFFSDPTPIDLGAEGEYHLERAQPNRYARISGLPSVAKVQYKQLGTAYKVFYILGSRVFVRAELRPRDGKPHDGWTVYQGSGRLLDLRTESEYVNIRAWYRDRIGFDFSRPAWILLDGVAPRRQWQYPIAVGVLLLVAVFNLVLLARRLLTARSG